MDNKYAGFSAVTISSCPGGPRPKDHRLYREDEVVDYLESGTLVGECLGWMTDVVTGKQVPGVSPNVRADDKYLWGESLAYYLRNYSVDLPPDFLKHIYLKLDH